MSNNEPKIDAKIETIKEDVVEKPIDVVKNDEDTNCFR
jgi:hypothetical protein